MLGRLIRTVVLGVVVAALALAGGGWYYADQALARGVPGPEARDVEVVAINGDRVTLRAVDAPTWAVQDLVGDLVVGFDHDRGYLRLRGAPVGDVGDDPATATRRFEVVVGTPPAIGDLGAIEVAAYPDDPGALGLAFEDVVLAGELGSFPGWVFPGAARADEWVVIVHGRGGTREGGLRAVDHVVGELGMSALVISYRNDPGAPLAPDGKGQFGDSEWRDLEEWLAWVRRSRDPSSITLLGQSQGGSLVAACMRRCAATQDIDRIVLDAPLLSLSETLRLQATNRGIPGIVQGPLLRTAGWIMERRTDIRTDRVEHVVALANMDLPILVFHGTNDTTVPEGPSRALANLDPDQVRLVTHDGEHVRAWNVDEAAYDRALTTFLAESG